MQPTLFTDTTTPPTQSPEQQNDQDLIAYNDLLVKYSALEQEAKQWEAQAKHWEMTYGELQQKYNDLLLNKRDGLPRDFAKHETEIREQLCKRIVHLAHSDRKIFEINLIEACAERACQRFWPNDVNKKGNHIYVKSITDSLKHWIIEDLKWLTKSEGRYLVFTETFKKAHNISDWL